MYRRDMKENQERHDRKLTKEHTTQKCDWKMTLA